MNILKHWKSDWEKSILSSSKRKKRNNAPKFPHSSKKADLSSAFLIRSFDTPSSVAPCSDAEASTAGSDGHRSRTAIARDLVRRGSWRIGTNPCPVVMRPKNHKGSRQEHLLRGVFQRPKSSLHHLEFTECTSSLRDCLPKAVSLHPADRKSTRLNSSHSQIS